MICDLHMHSHYSDGTFTPEELIAEAKRLGLDAVALTDHNTVAGLERFMSAAGEAGVVAIGGVELSTAYRDVEFHLLGLFVEPQHYGAIERLAKEFHIIKEISNIETIERLNEAGYMISYTEIRKKHPHGNVNRAHLAAELLKEGYISSIAEAFEGVLKEEAGFYVPPARLGLFEAIEFLKGIRAIPILAHPLKDADEAFLRELLPCAVSKGLLGIETYHSDYGKEKTEAAKRLAKDFCLYESGGSDFHGDNKPNIKMAFGKGDLAIPTRIYETLLSLKEKI